MDGKDTPLLEEEEAQLKEAQEIETSRIAKAAVLPNTKRSKTLGMHINKSRTIFQWSPDGKISEVKILDQESLAEETNKPQSKFGSLSGFGAMSAKSGKSG